MFATCVVTSLYVLACTFHPDVPVKLTPTLKVLKVFPVTTALGLLALTRMPVVPDVVCPEKLLLTIESPAAPA